MGFGCLIEPPHLLHMFADTIESHSRRSGVVDVAVVGLRPGTFVQRIGTVHALGVGGGGKVRDTTQKVTW